MRQPKHYTFALAALVGSFWPLALFWEHGLSGDDKPATKQRDVSAEETASKDATLPALKFSPNTFPAQNENRATLFHLDWPATPLGSFEVLIYDLVGQPVRHVWRGNQTDGSHALVWDGKDDASRPVPPGKYWYRIKTEKRLYSKMLIVVR